MQLKNNTFPPLLHEVRRVPVPGILKDIVNKKPAKTYQKPMKRVGKSNARSEGRAGLFFIDTSQKKIIMFSSPASLQSKVALRVDDYQRKCA